MQHFLAEYDKGKIVDLCGTVLSFWRKVLQFFKMYVLRTRVIFGFEKFMMVM
jgi:hypothetical protein